MKMVGDVDGGTRRKKKTLGRRKLVMKRIEDANHLQVRFSKRKKGLFKKAQELAVRCGAQVLVIVFSPAGKPFSYGYPCVSVVADRFLSPWTHEAAAASAEATLQVKAEFDELERQARDREEELQWRTDLGKAMSADDGGVWTDADDLEGLDLTRLEALLAALERVQAEAADRVHEMVVAEQAMMMQYASGGGMLHCYGPGPPFTADGTAGGDEVVAMADTASMSSGAGSFFQYYLSPSSFTVDGASTSHHQGMVMDTTTMNLQMSAGNYLGPFTAAASHNDGIAMNSALTTSMGGNVCHHALAPRPPLSLPSNQGDHHGHGHYNQGDGVGDGDHRGHVDGLYEMKGVYACNFFG